MWSLSLDFNHIHGAFPGAKWHTGQRALAPRFRASLMYVYIYTSISMSLLLVLTGEPVLCGFARSFGLRLGDERREWVKPIMFSGGIGSIDDRNLYKQPPKIGKCAVPEAIGWVSVMEQPQ
mgnify:FL=1